MKIDRTKLKKSNSDVPADCGWLIEKLQVCNNDELLEVLRGFHSWSYGKCELYHWTYVLDRFDGILEQAAARQPPASPELQESWVLHCDLPQNAQSQELVVWVLHFTTLLVEHSFSRHLYSSVDHLISLLSSSSMTVVLAVLNLLYMFSKRSNFIARLSAGPRQTLLARLMHLAESWGGKENGFDLARCCCDLPLECYPPSATTLHFEAVPKDTPSGGEGAASKHPPPTVPVQYPALHKHALGNTPSQIMDEILLHHRIPQQSQMAVFTHLRLACHFGRYETRLQCVQARLQALSVLVYCNALQDNANTMLYSGLLDEFVAVLELKEPGLTEIKAATLRTLTSIIHLERLPYFPKLSTIMDVTGASSYHGFLPVLVRSCIASLTSSNAQSGEGSSSSSSPVTEEQQFPAPLATALFSFLYHLASYESGGEALVACGMMEALLSVVNWRTTEPDHITFVTRAVRVIDLITNLDMQAFQVHGGLSAFINRLELEVNECRKEQPFVIDPPSTATEDAAAASPQPMETDAGAGNGDTIHSTGSTSSVSPPDASTLNLGTDDEERDDLPPPPDVATVTPTEPATTNDSQPNRSPSETPGCSTDVVQPDYSAAKTNLTCLAQRAALLKSMLNFLKKAIQDPAFSDSMRHLMEASLPSSLRHIISNAEYYGPSLFLLATDVVTVYVFGEPSFLSSLQDNGLTNVVLHALLIKDIPATREVLSSLPNVFSALCLNSRGLQAFVACRPFEKLFKVLLSPDYLLAMRRRRSADPMGDTASNLGNAMDELMRHQPSLKTVAMKAIVMLLKELCHLGKHSSYVCWKTPPKHEPSPAPSSRSLERETNDNSSDEEEYEEEEREPVTENGSSSVAAPVVTATPVTTIGESSSSSCLPGKDAGNSSTGEKKPVPLVDYILNVMKFVDAILSNNATDDHCKEFVQQKGLAPLLEILGLPNLPVDFPSSTACVSVGSVCKSILNLAHESGVVRCGLECVEQQLQTLAPFNENRSSESMLLLEVRLAIETSGSEALNSPADPLLNAQQTPLMHTLTAVHAYCSMLVYVCRTSQTDIRQLSVSQWGSEVGLRVLSGLALLYQTLVWETTILINTNATLEKKAAAEAQKEKESPSDAMDVEPSTSELSTELQLKLSRQLLASASRLGKALAELFTLLVRLCVGSPLRQRRGQSVPPTPASPSLSARTVADSLARLLHSLLHWPPPPQSEEEAADLTGSNAVMRSVPPLNKLQLTFMICSVRFTSPMLFDDKKMPYHLLMHYFFNCHGLTAFFESFEWALEAADSHFRTLEPPGTGTVDEVGDMLLEYLESWCSLLERLVNPRNMLESPHALPPKIYPMGCLSFRALAFLMHIQKVAFGAVLKIWEKSCVTSFSLSLTEVVLSILSSILKAESLIYERVIKEKQSSPSSQGGGNNSLSLGGIGSSLVMVASAPSTNIPASVVSTSVSATPQSSSAAIVSAIDSSSDPSSDPSAPAVTDASPAAATSSSSAEVFSATPAAVSETPLSTLETGSEMLTSVSEVTVSTSVANVTDSHTTEDSASASGAPAQSSESSASTSDSSTVVSNTAASAAASGRSDQVDDDDEDEDDDDSEATNNRQRLRALVDMGFPEQRCMRAIAETSTLEQATEYLLMSPSTDHIGLSILGGLGADAPDVDLSEDAQMLRAIAMSLQEDLTAPEVVAEAGPSSSSSVPASAGTEATPLADGTQPSATPAARSKTPQGRPQLIDSPLKKEELDAFTDNILEGCLRKLDVQGQIVYKVCDLLTTCSKRNGAEWLERMLNTLVDQISAQALELQHMASSAGCYEDVRQLWASPLANKFAMRLHLMTLLLEEVRHTCTQHINCEDLIGHLTLLLCDTEAAMSSYPRPSPLTSVVDDQQPQETPPTSLASSATSVSLLLMPLSFAPNDIPERTSATSNKQQQQQQQQQPESCTPKWIAPTLLFIDLYEKIFIAASKRMKLLKKHKRVWKCFDVNSHKWVAYTAANSKIIDDAYFAGESSVRIVNARRKYLIQFASLVQISEESGNRRPVMVSWDDDATSTKVSAKPGFADTPAEGGDSSTAAEVSTAADFPPAESAAAADPLLQSMEQQFLNFMQASSDWGPHERSSPQHLPPPPVIPGEESSRSRNEVLMATAEDPTSKSDAQETMDVDEATTEDGSDSSEELPENISESLVRVCVGLLRLGVDTDTLHAVLRLSLRLTRVWSRAAQFARLGGIKALLQCSDAFAFKGFHNLAALLMRHVLEEPRTLRYAMEKAVRGTLGSNSHGASAATGSSSGRELHYLLRLLAPASCRSHEMLTSLAQDMLRISCAIPHQVSRPILHQPNNEDVVFCQMSPSFKSSSNSSSSTECSTEAQQVIRDLLDALATSGDDATPDQQPSSPIASATPSCLVNGTTEAAPSARRQLDLSRSSSINDMVVQDTDDASPMESDSSKLPNAQANKTKGKRRLLSRWSICKLLAEFVRCYSDVAKLVTEHVYTPETTNNLTHECSALAYMLDWFVSGASSTSPPTTEDGRGYVRLLVGALASCNHAPESQAILVTEVKSALYRACQTPESSAKHEQVQSLVNLICTMMETCPSHYSTPPSVFSKNNVGMNNMLRILVRKGVITDLARIPHCLDLSSPHLAGTVNASLKALEMVARVMNHVTVVPPAAARKKAASQTTSSTAAATSTTTTTSDTAAASSSAGASAGQSSGPRPAGDQSEAANQSQREEEEEEEVVEGDDEDEEEQTLHVEDEVEQHDNGARDLDALLNSIIDNRRRETESGGEGGDDDGGDDDDDDDVRNRSNALATLTFVISDQPMDTEEDTLHDSRMVTHSESQFMEDHEETNDDPDSSSSSSDSSDDDDDDDNDDGDNEDNEDVVHDENHADGDDEDEDMDDGSVIDEEEEEEDEEEEEEEEEAVLFDDSYIRMAGAERDSDDMVMLPTYQHYIDTIDTIDHMIFGNRLTIPQHSGGFGLHDDQGFVALSAPSSSAGGSGGSPAIPAHPLLQNPREGGAVGSTGTAAAGGGAGGSAGATGGGGGAGGRGAQARGGRSRGVLRYSHTPRTPHSTTSAVLQRLLGRNPTDVLELSSNLRDATQVWFTNQDVRIIQPDSDPLLSQSTSLLGSGSSNSLSNIPSSLARWTEEARVLHSDAVHDTIIRVKAPLLAVLEKRRAAEQAEKDRKKKELEAAAKESTSAASSELPSLLSSRGGSGEPSNKSLVNPAAGDAAIQEQLEAAQADASSSTVLAAYTTPSSSAPAVSAPSDNYSTLEEPADGSFQDDSVVTSEMPSVESTLTNSTLENDFSSNIPVFFPNLVPSTASMDDPVLLLDSLSSAVDAPPMSASQLVADAVSTALAQTQPSTAEAPSLDSQVDVPVPVPEPLMVDDLLPPVPPLPQFSSAASESENTSQFQDTSALDTDGAPSNVSIQQLEQGESLPLPEAMAVSPASSPPPNVSITPEEAPPATEAPSPAATGPAAAEEGSSAAVDQLQQEQAAASSSNSGTPGIIYARDTEYAAILGDIEIPEGVDPSFLAALPEEMRQEVISEHLRLQRARTRTTDASSSRPAGSEEVQQEPAGEVNPEFLAALPPNIQEEVLAQQRVQQAASARHNPDEPVDAAQFLEALPPSLRQTILTDLDNSQFSALPPDLAQEAQTLRRQREERVRHAHDHLLQTGGGGGMRSHTLSHILRNTARLGNRIMQSGSWSTSWNLQPSSSSSGQHASALSSKSRGRQLLDHEALSCLLVLLFLDDSKLNTARLHRVLRHLCSHGPTRRWVIATLLSMMEKCQEMHQPHSLNQAPSASLVKLSSTGDASSPCLTPDHSKGAIKKSSKTPASVFTSTPHSKDSHSSISKGSSSASSSLRDPVSSNIKSPISSSQDSLSCIRSPVPQDTSTTSGKSTLSTPPAWLSMSIDAALGCRANVFQIQRPLQLGKKSSSSQPSTVAVSIHPQASPLVCKHALDALISLGKIFTVHFLPYRNARGEMPSASSGKSEDKKSGEREDTKEEANKSTSNSTNKLPLSTDFWELLVKLDTINVCKKGKGLARSHSSSGTNNSAEEEEGVMSLEQSPLGQLLEQLSHPVIKRSAMLTDKLLKLLALVSGGFGSSTPAAHLLKNHKYSEENLDALDRLFSLAIQVLTSKSCSEEGLEDATVILVNLSHCPAPARSLVLRLLLQGASTLGGTVATHINALLHDLRAHVASSSSTSGSSSTDHHQDTASKGMLRDRFTQEDVVVVGQSTGRNKAPSSGSELQLASMPALTSKTSSQAFFLRTLKVIVQLRDASTRRANTTNTSSNSSRTAGAPSNAAGPVSDAAGSAADVPVSDAPVANSAEAAAGSSSVVADSVAVESPSDHQQEQQESMDIQPSDTSSNEPFTSASPTDASADAAATSALASATSTSASATSTSASATSTSASATSESASAISESAFTLASATSALNSASASATSALASVTSALTCVSASTSTSALDSVASALASATSALASATSVLTSAAAAAAAAATISDTAPTAASSNVAADATAAVVSRTTSEAEQKAETSSNQDSPPEDMEVDQEDEVLKLQSLSHALQLDELWQALSRCLDELAESPDSHAVLVLQPAVEAFFLVHATAAAAAAASSSSQPRTITAAETRESQLAHLNDLAPMSPLPPVLSPQPSTAGNTTEDGEAVNDTSLATSSTLSDSEKFLKFAERHRSVLNQILRQSTVHLADGPFSVLVDHIRLLDFDIKRKYFRTELERADDGVRREDLTVHVRRDHVFEDSFRELHRRSSDDWKNRFYIVFEGEEGQDAGGLLREWYMIISREIFNPMYALFCISPGDRVTYMINSSSHCNSNHLSYFKFVGRVIAKAVYDNKLLECYFTRSFYKHILGKMVRFTDMESEDYSFYQGLVYLMENDVNTLGYELTFSTEVQEFGVTEVRELKPGGEKIAVTEDNKIEYIKLVCQMKMTGAIRKQLNAFLEGFYDIIPKRLISIFNEQELELLISGLPNIDIDDLRANTEYHKYQPNSLQIQWFWRALRGFDQAERAKFLQFVTGTSKVPLQGFAALEGMNGIQKFQIHRDDRATDRLPSAHTCFNQLDLPVYETYDKLRHYLLKAVHECSEGFGFA